MDLELRPLVVSDAEVFASWAIDPVFCAHAGWKESSSVAEGVPWWRDLIANPDPKLLRLAAVRGKEIVGYVDLYGDGTETRELGFVIGPSANWGNGWGTRAARAGLAYGFELMGLTSVWAEAVGANAGSVRILQRVGMTYTGAGDDELFLGVPSTYVQFGLTRSEWLIQSAQQPPPTLPSTFRLP